MTILTTLTNHAGEATPAVAASVRAALSKAVIRPLELLAGRAEAEQDETDDTERGLPSTLLSSISSA